MGYNAEKNGKLAEAIDYYRHAEQIDPKIEFNVRDELAAFRKQQAHVGLNIERYGTGLTK